MAKEMKELMEFLDELRHSYAEFRDQEIKRRLNHFIRYEFCHTSCASSA